MPTMAAHKMLNIRFPEKDTQLYDDAQRLATQRRISLAELIRRCLIAEVDKATESGELRKEEAR